MVTASWDDALERVRDNNSVIEKWNCAGVACKFQQSISYKLESWIAQHSAYSQTDSSRIAGIFDAAASRSWYTCRRPTPRDLDRGLSAAERLFCHSPAITKHAEWRFDIQVARLCQMTQIAIRIRQLTDVVGGL
jgi:hypothetical protein